MSEDPSVRWQQANPNAIQVEGSSSINPLEGIYHAGRVNDVLILGPGAEDSGSLLAGTDGGGVWQLWPLTSGVRPLARPLSDDWDNPDVSCLGQGPNSPTHVYAGCDAALYETDTSQGFPLENWRDISPAGIGGTYRMVVLDEARLIVLACVNGVFWSPIPAAGGAYSWKQAAKQSNGQAFPSGRYAGITEGPSWQTWFRIGDAANNVQPRTPVTVSSRGKDHLDLFVVGNDGGIYTAWWDANFPGSLNGGWQPWFRIGDAAANVPVGSVVTAVSRNASHVDIFVVGNDGGIYTAWWDVNFPGPLNGGWQPWFRIGGAANSVPVNSVVTAAVRGSGHLDIFVVGSDGGVYTAWWDVQSPGTLTGGWHPWFRIGDAANNVPLKSIVTPVSRDSTHIDIFVVGNDGGIYTARWAADRPGPLNGGWQQWFRVGDAAANVPVGSVVTAIARTSNHLDLFVVGTDGGTYSTWWDDPGLGLLLGGWNQWFRIGNQTVPQLSVLSAVSRDTNHLELFVVGTDGGIYWTWWDGNRGWRMWRRIGEDWAKVPAQSVVSAVSRGTNQVDAFVVGTDGGIYSTRWNPSVVVATWGPDFFTGLHGIFRGEWVPRPGAPQPVSSFDMDLVMTRSQLPPQDPGSLFPFDAFMERTSLAACPFNPENMFAICADTQRSLMALLKSTDGGKSWAVVQNAIVTNRSNQALSAVLNQVDVGHLSAIAVSPVDSNIVAVGWQNGVLISTNGGTQWQLFDKSLPELHDDVSTVYFDPFDPAGRRLLACTDGGLVITSDLGQHFDTSMNRYLLNLEFYSTTSIRNFYGTLTVLDDVVAGGLQDNANVFCGTGLDLGPWFQIPDGGCDGGLAMFIATGQVLSDWVCSGNGGSALATFLDLGLPFDTPQSSVVPLRVPGQPDNKNGLTSPAVEVVNTPTYKNAAGQLMFAVASANVFTTQTVYGLFADDNGDDLHWEQLGTVQSDAQNDGISALGSATGSTIFIGTSLGRIFKLTPSPAAPVSGQKLGVSLPPSTPQGTIHRIVVRSDTLAFATYNTGTVGYVLRFDGTKWTALSGGLPGDVFYALTVDSTLGTLFAATDTRVYVSRDSGNSWQSASQGLPKRPHCADLRFVRQNDGKHFLYLSTYGRSLWRANLNIPHKDPKSEGKEHVDKVPEKDVMDGPPPPGGFGGAPGGGTPTGPLRHGRSVGATGRAFIRPEKRPDVGASLFREAGDQETAN